MNLISYKDSWEEIQNSFNKYYENVSKKDYLNLKNFLFNTKINTNDYLLYIDTLKKDNNYFKFSIYRTLPYLRVVLNDTVTDIPYYSFGDPMADWIVVFKHDSSALQNIVFDDTGYSSLRLFEFHAIIVPEGLKQDYINLFSQCSGWGSAYENKIYEGDEFTDLQEEFE